MASKRLSEGGEPESKANAPDCTDVYKDIDDDITSNLQTLGENEHDSYRKDCINNLLKELADLTISVQNKSLEDLNTMLRSEKNNHKKNIIRKQRNILIYGKPVQQIPQEVKMDIEPDKYVDDKPELLSKTQQDYMNTDDINTQRIVMDLVNIFNKYKYLKNYKDFFEKIDRDFFLNKYLHLPCYTSYHYPIDLTKKHYIWFSQNLSQSILHLFDRSRQALNVVRPVIYKFTLNLAIKNIILFKKATIEFSDISFLFPQEIRINIGIELSRYFKSTLAVIFNEEKNRRLLYIFEALNHFLGLENKIYGYRNYNDQDEFGMINQDLFESVPIQSFYKNIQITKTLKYHLGAPIIDIIEFNNEDKILSSDYFNTYLIFSLYRPKDGFIQKGLQCKGEVVVKNERGEVSEYVVDINSITYQNFDNLAETSIFNCADDNNYMQKYLKYKQKYLNLKNLMWLS